LKQRGGTIVFVSHDAQAVERLCDRAVLLRRGEVAFDGPTREAISRYRQLLDADGDERLQVAAGEPVVVRLVIWSEQRVAPPSVSLELRDDDGVVLGSVVQSTADLGWDGAPGRRELRFELDALPLAEGRFHLRSALVEAEGGRLLHSLDDAIRFFVFPAGGQTGAVLLSGRWTMQE